MSRPVRPPAEDEAPSVDPAAIDRAVRLQRARRRARIEQRRARRAGRVRFWLVLLALLAASVVLALVSWREIERLFGL